MSMITDLVKRLKDLYVDSKLDMLCGVDGECRQAIKESAQVIEELSAKLQSANMERSSQYYNGGWIPVSERLPEKEGKYITTVKSGGFYDVRESFFEKYPFDITNWVEIGEVIAWMPLPEPYKESEE